MNVLSHMARPASDEVPVAYFDFMTRDSVSIRFYYAARLFYCFPLLFLCKKIFGVYPHFSNRVIQPLLYCLLLMKNLFQNFIFTFFSFFSSASKQYM